MRRVDNSLASRQDRARARAVRDASRLLSLPDELLTVVLLHLPLNTKLKLMTASRATAGLLRTLRPLWHSLDLSDAYYSVVIGDVELRWLLLHVDAPRNTAHISLKGCSRVCGKGLEPLLRSHVVALSRCSNPGATASWPSTHAYMRPSGLRFSSAQLETIDLRTHLCMDHSILQPHTYLDRAAYRVLKSMLPSGEHGGVLAHEPPSDAPKLTSYDPGQHVHVKRTDGTWSGGVVQEWEASLHKYRILLDDGLAMSKLVGVEKLRMAPSAPASPGHGAIYRLRQVLVHAQLDPSRNNVRQGRVLLSGFQEYLYTLQERLRKSTKRRIALAQTRCGCGSCTQPAASECGFCDVPLCNPHRTFWCRCCSRIACADCKEAFTTGEEWRHLRCARCKRRHFCPECALHEVDRRPHGVMEGCGCCPRLVCHDNCADACRCEDCGTAICAKCESHGNELCCECHEIRVEFWSPSADESDHSESDHSESEGSSYGVHQGEPPEDE